MSKTAPRQPAGPRTLLRKMALPLGLLALAALAVIAVLHHSGPPDPDAGPPPPTVPGGAFESIATTNPARVNLLLFGDWGQNTPAERAVAGAIRSYAQANAVHFDAGLLLGDNFYVPLTGVDDPRWRALFEDLYEPASLRFWAILGNHDYGMPAGPRPTVTPESLVPFSTPKRPAVPRLRNKDVELEYARRHPGGRFNLPARWYRLDLPAADPWLTVLMLDSNYDEPSQFSDADWQRQTAWLAAQLEDVRPADPAKPRRNWVVCCAHHPIFTNGGTHPDDLKLGREWLPMLESHGVDFYATGHNHCMEHLWIAGSRVSYVVAGGGGAGLYHETRQHPGWFARAHGFVHLSVAAGGGATARYVGVDGRVLYEFTRDADGTEHHPPDSHPAALPAEPPDVPAGDEAD